MAYLYSFLIQPRIPLSRALGVSWALKYQFLIKNVPPKKCPEANIVDLIGEWKAPSSEVYEWTS